MPRRLPRAQAAFLTSRGFFPTLISPALAHGLPAAFGFAAATLTTWADLPRRAACARRFLSCCSVGTSSASVSMNNTTNRGA